MESVKNQVFVFCSLLTLDQNVSKWHDQHVKPLGLNQAIESTGFLSFSHYFFLFWTSKIFLSRAFWQFSFWSNIENTHKSLMKTMKEKRSIKLISLWFGSERLLNDTGQNTQTGRNCLTRKRNVNKVSILFFLQMF